MGNTSHQRPPRPSSSSLWIPRPAYNASLLPESGNYISSSSEYPYFLPFHPYFLVLLNVHIPPLTQAYPTKHTTKPNALRTMFAILLAVITMALLIFPAAARRCFVTVAKLMMLVIVTWFVNSMIAYCFQALWVCSTATPIDVYLLFR